MVRYDTAPKQTGFGTTLYGRCRLRLVIETTARDEPWLTKFSNGSLAATGDTPTLGGGEDGFRPHELLEAALACCLNMSVRMKAESADIPLDDVSTRVALDRTDEETVFRYELDMTGDLTDDQRDVLETAAATCPVRQTLSKEIGFSYED